MLNQPATPSLDQSLRARLDSLSCRSLYRKRRLLESPQSGRIQLDGKPVLNVCSNDYLGLANDPRLIEALQRGADHYGVGSGASHLVVGHSRAHEQLELALAEFTGRERALLFANGYSANMAVIRALVSAGDCVFQDRLNHASLLDGGWLSRAEVQWFDHRHYLQLHHLLQQADSNNVRHKLIVTDGVFSMDGDCCDVAALVPLARENGAWLMIDDAHGFGVLGERGAGCADAKQFSQDDVPVLIGTFGKAFGTAGAFVAGSDALIEWLIQKARQYIFTTAMPSAIATATLASLSIVQSETWRRDHLYVLIDRFITAANQYALPLLPSSTPIQPLLVGDSRRCLQISAALEARSIYAAAIRPPTVPEGGARIRITLSAAHHFEDVDYLVKTLAEIFHA